MAKYIDKSALVAEIEKRQSIVLDPLNNNIHTKRLEETYKSILSFINTLEVKEVQEEPVSNDLEAEFVLYLKHKFNISQEGNTLKTDGWRPSPYDILAIAKHFAKWQKEQDAIEVKEVDLDKIVDDWYNTKASKEFENVLYSDIENCAKYFFELGLMHRKDNLYGNKY